MNRNHNPPKKILRISNPSDAEDLMAFHCLLPLGDLSSSRSLPAVSPPFSSATPALSGTFHCMLSLGYPPDSSPAVYPLIPALQFHHCWRFHCRRFHLAIHPTPRRLYIHLFQLCNSSVITSRDIGFHCCLPLGDPSGSVPHQLYLRHSISAIPASPGTTISSTLSSFPGASSHRTPPLPPPPLPPPLSPPSHSGMDG